MLEPALLREDQGVLRLLPFIFFMIQLLPSARMAECNVFWSWNDISTIAISILLHCLRSLLDIKHQKHGPKQSYEVRRADRFCAKDSIG